MLVEIRCDKFISHSDIRPPIYFHSEINTVLDSETGSISIGKSTFLMIIDFAFGGEDYVLKSTDVQTQVGENVVKFAFKFNNEMYYFSRETINHTIVYQCDDNFNPIRDMKIDEYKKLLFGLIILIFLR